LFDILLNVWFNALFDVFDKFCWDDIILRVCGATKITTTTKTTSPIIKKIIKLTASDFFIFYIYYTKEGPVEDEVVVLDVVVDCVLLVVVDVLDELDPPFIWFGKLLINWPVWFVWFNAGFITLFVPVIPLENVPVKNNTTNTKTTSPITIIIIISIDNDWPFLTINFYTIAIFLNFL